jgi:tagatose 6-phosphate kinase
VILAVCLNLALDITYRVASLRVGETTRVADVFERAGGKAVNAARVLDALGHEVLVMGFAGGRVGDAVVEELDRAGLVHDLVPIAGQTRRTLIVVDDEHEEPTGMSETGPEISPDEWHALVARFSAHEPAAVVLAGSLPPGLPDDAYATLIAAAGDVPVLLDTSGSALRAGAAARPAIVKVNRDEIGPGDPVAAARALGAPAVVVSLGAGGLVAVTDDGGELRAAPPEVVTGNPIGAGDAASAALVAGLVAGTPWPERLADAAALSAAAVHAPMAGSFDAGAYERYRAATRGATGRVAGRGPTP